MPWRQEPKKDVVDCEKLRGTVSRCYIRIRIREPVRRIGWKRHSFRPGCAPNRRKSGMLERAGQSALARKGGQTFCDLAGQLGSKSCESRIGEPSSSPVQQGACGFRALRETASARPAKLRTGSGASRVRDKGKSFVDRLRTSCGTFGNRVL
jgi:hypothetical protein